MTDKNIDFASLEHIPCSPDTSPLAVSEAMKLLPNLSDEWSINDNGHLEMSLLVKDFNESMGLANNLSTIADNLGHYPVLVVSYSKLVIEIWSHQIGGMHKSDFILAARFDRALGKE